jgi:hypothetical protein
MTLHAAFGLPTDRPFFRTQCALRFGETGADGRQSLVGGGMQGAMERRLAGASAPRCCKARRLSLTG